MGAGPSRAGWARQRGCGGDVKNTHNLLSGAKRIPEISAARREWSDFYRSMRRKNPKMARLVFRRAKRAEKAVIDHFLWGTPLNADHLTA